MRKRSKLFPIILLTFTVPILMGTDKCEGGGGGLLLEIFKEIGDSIHQLQEKTYELMEETDELTERVDALEDCDCEGILDPVCGEDGLTYINSCEASCRDIAEEAAGECALPVCGGNTGQSCDEGSFCESAPGCNEDDVGRCEAQPETCDRSSDPVCGCDGDTYPNDCERRAAGVSLDHEGSCDDVPVECVDNDECGEGEFCNKAPDSCDEMGRCQPQPDACTRDYNPVCGCDEMTYSNACSAHASGVAVAARGRCDDDGGKDKVKICHNPKASWLMGHTIEVARPAVPAHLRHGDYLGRCHRPDDCNDESHWHHKHKKRDKDHDDD